MDCDQELLQEFLDGELDPGTVRQIQAHLGTCVNCRREYSRQRRLWLELAQPEAVAAPPELPYLRQQAIAAVRLTPAESGTSIGFWEFQQLAWAPLGLATAYIPGSGVVKTMMKTAARELPGLVGGILASGGRRWLQGQFGKKGCR